MFIMSGSQKLSKKKSKPSLLEINRQANRKKKPTLFSAPHPAQNQPSTWVKF